MREVSNAGDGTTVALILHRGPIMKVSQTIAVSVSSVLFLGMMTLSNGLALAREAVAEKFA